MVAVSELVSGLDAELVRLGYKASTMKWYRGCWARLERFFVSRGEQEFSLETAMAWVDESCGGFFIKEQAGRPFENPSALEDFYVRTAEFPAGFMTEYAPSLLTAAPTHQDLATGFPLGKRFKSAPASRVCDTNPVQLGHHATADGRWRIYVFADAAKPGTGSRVDSLADWIATAPDSPLAATPEGSDADAWFDVKVIYQQPHEDIDINAVPAVFKPLVGPFELTDYEKVYGSVPGDDIFDVRGLSRDGVIVVVRPDQYVANVLPLTATAELADFFKPIMLPR